MFSIFGDDFSEYLHKDSGSISFIVLSTAFMELLDEITRGNTIIPIGYIPGSSEREQTYFIHEYIRGFFDQRAKIITRTKRISSSPFLRIKPQVIIKKENREILSELEKLLRSIGLSPTKPTKHKGSKGYYHVVSINKAEDIQRVIDIPLFASQEKLEKLIGLYESWKDLMAEDKYGVLGRRLLNAAREKRKQEVLA